MTTPQVFTCVSCGKLKPIAEGIRVTQLQFLPEQVYNPMASPGGLTPDINFREIKVPVIVCTLCVPIGLEA